METALILSQTIFYFAVSLAIIVIAIFLSMGMYYLVLIAKELKAITQDLHNLTDEAQERIRDIIERLSELPILSYFLKRRRKQGHSEGGKKGHKPQ